MHMVPIQYIHNCGVEDCQHAKVTHPHHHVFSDRPPTSDQTDSNNSVLHVNVGNMFSSTLVRQVQLLRAHMPQQTSPAKN